MTTIADIEKAREEFAKIATDDCAACFVVMHSETIRASLDLHAKWLKLRETLPPELDHVMKFWAMHDEKDLEFPPNVCSIYFSLKRFLAMLNASKDPLEE